MTNLTVSQIAANLKVNRCVIEHYVRSHRELGTWAGHARVYSPQEVHQITQGIEQQKYRKRS
jgi:hypothetical protein